MRTADETPVRAAQPSRPPRAPREPIRTILHDLTGRGATGLPMALVVHPGVLPAKVYQRLADELAVDHDVFAVDLTGIAEYERAAMAGGEPGITVEEVGRRFCGAASEYVALAPAVVLIGWSFGGTLSFEMARQFDSGECAVRRPIEVLLLDAMAPREKLPDDLTKANAALLSWFGMYLGGKRGRALRLDEERFEGLTVEDGLAVVRDEAAERDVLAAETPVVGLRKLFDTFVDGLVHYTKLTSAYHSQPTRRPLTLVKADGSLRPENRDLGWSVLADGELSIRDCPGDHYTMLSDPEATAVLAELVREKSDGLLAAGHQQSRTREEVAKA